MALRYIGEGSTVVVHLALPHRTLTDEEVAAITTLAKGSNAPYNQAVLVASGNYTDQPAPGDGDGEGDDS